MKKQFQTIYFKNKPRIIGSYSIVGPKEGLGSLKHYFDYIMMDDLFGEKTYEKEFNFIFVFIDFSGM